MKLSEWLKKNIDSHTAYDWLELKEQMEKETNSSYSHLKFYTESSKEINKTFGQIKGIQQKLPENLIVMSGYSLSQQLAGQLCKKTTFSQYIGRGFSFRAAISDLELAGF